MECNRDEALRALAIAEQKFLSGDLFAAKNLAVKAQALFPGLEVVTRFMAVLDVHIASRTRIGTEDMDWYDILQVHPDADVDTVKKQYRKLALLVHPDKNNSLGAASAFKLIVDALQVLSDKMKRKVFDMKRTSRSHISRQNVDCPDVAGRYRNRSQQHPTGSKEQLNFYQYSLINRRSPLYPFTFSAVCPLCQTRYQLLRRFENQNLSCPRCRQRFIAKDVSFSRWGSSTEATGRQVHVVSPFTYPLNVKDRKRSLGKHIKLADKNQKNVENGKHASTFEEAFLHNTDKLIRRSDSCQKAASPENMCRKEERINEQERENEDETIVPAMTQNKCLQINKSENLEEDLRARGDLEEKRKPEAVDGSSQSDVLAGSKDVRQTVDLKKKRRVRSKAAKVKDREEKLEVRTDDQEMYPGRLSKTNVVSDQYPEIDDDFQGLPSAKKAKVNARKPADGSGKPSRPTRAAKGATKRSLKLKEDGPEATADPGTKPQLLNRRYKMEADNGRYEMEDDGNPKLSEGKSEAKYTVPDGCYFHDFNEGREEGDVEVGQVWALYDEKEGMPKLYMKVKRVECRCPFRVVIGWCEPWKPSREQRQVLVSGFSIACGEFRTRSRQMLSNVNSFSHAVKCEKGPKGTIVIYPKKGDIWAIYTDWESRQSLKKISTTPGKSAVVEILSDCTETSGVSVSLLERVQGFKTLFAPALREHVLQIPFREVSRFSHQVPAHQLNGDEAPTLPRRCWELDVAAVPQNLIYSETGASSFL